MGGLFSTPEDRLREQIDLIDDSTLDLDMDIRDNMREQDRLFKEVRAHAARGDAQAAHRLAESLVITQTTLATMYQRRTQLATMKATTREAELGIRTGRVMQENAREIMRANAQMSLPRMRLLSMAYLYHTQQLQEKSSMVAEAFADILEDANAENEGDLTAEDMVEKATALNALESAGSLPSVLAALPPVPSDFQLQLARDLRR